MFRKNGNAKAAIISSANLTRNGMELNHEWGVQIDKAQMIDAVEMGMLADVEFLLTEEQVIAILKQAHKEHPDGVEKVKSQVVDIANIVMPLKVTDGVRIFIKPYGSSESNVFKGDFSHEKRMYFSTKFPRAVRIGDILISYAVGACNMFGAYRVTSKPIRDEYNNPRWPWYVEADCMTPSLANHKWENANLRVTTIANKYAEKHNKPVTKRGKMNLNGIKHSNDKIRLNDEYGRYLLSLLRSFDLR